MKNMKPVYVIAVCFMTLLVLGCVSCGQHEKQQKAMEEQAARQKTEAEAKQQAEKKEETSLVQDTISKNNDFAICQVGAIDFTQQWQETSDGRLTPTKENSIDSEIQQRVLDSHGLTSAEPSACLSGDGICCENRSDSRFARSLNLLAAVGYIAGRTDYLKSIDLYPWYPTAKGKEALRAGVIKVTEFTGFSNGIFYGPGPNVDKFYKYDYRVGFTTSRGFVGHRWSFILGCRELQQVDATTALSDGLKVDFSWHWKVTDIGTADGLSGERQRGVAYFTRTANGLAIDKIKMEE